MVRIFDLPPGGLTDGAVAQEVDAQGTPIKKEEISPEEVNPVPSEQAQILRKEFINAQNDKDNGERQIIRGGDSGRSIFAKEKVDRSARDKDPDVKSEVTVTESEGKDPYREGFQTPTEDNPAGSNAGGMRVSMRPKHSVYLMRVEFPDDIITELNDHIDNVIIPARKDQSQGLVGQINRDERSAQWHFPHVGDEVGEQFSSVLCRLGQEYVEHAVGGLEAETDVQTMWTIHSYEGDYNPMHDHGTRTSMGLSVILYLKVPPQIEALANPSVDFKGLNGASGAVDGFTYLQWGTNGMRDANMLRPITEEYVKPEVGTMIVFPAWLRHGVMPFFGEGERRTFSANINITPSQEWAQAQYNDLKHKGKV